MKKFILLFILFPFLNQLSADENPNTFSRKEILKIADKYVNNSMKISNPAVVDADKDGDFDILNFTDDGKVEFYKNTNTNEEPVFVLENKNYDEYEVNSFLPSGLPIPVFFADKDGDKDVDLFGIVKDGFDSKTFKQNYKAVYAENAFDFDHYTLITIILVLLIIALVVVII